MKNLKGGEIGFLLLTSNLGNPGRKPLTSRQFWELMERSENMKSRDVSRDVDVYDFVSIGYSPKFAQHIVELLHDEVLLGWYLMQARKQGIVPITRATSCYPSIVRQRLGKDSPGCLWGRGDLSILNTKTIALVGSRELREENRKFAEEVGRQAALQGLTLVSGNARGADKTAQNACLRAGGKVISIVPDSLLDHRPRENVLYLSELSFDEGFSSHRALSRNKLIHCLGYRTFVAQSNLHIGGTWDGTTKNLRFGWSDVYCFEDGSQAVRELEQMGAIPIGMDALSDFGGLQQNLNSFLI